MIPFIHCIRDGGYAVGVTDDSYKGRAVPQRVCHITSRPLAQGADDGSSRNITFPIWMGLDKFG